MLDRGQRSIQSRRDPRPTW